MPEEQTTTTTPDPDAGKDEGTGTTDGTPANESTEVDWKAKAREWEKRAKANADAADKLAKFEDAQKSEAQRLTEARDAAAAEAAEARAETLRYKVATKYAISSDDAETFLTGTDEDTLTKQAERLAALAKDSKPDSTTPGPRPDLSQGARAGNPQGDPATAFGNFIKGQLNQR
jgi:hypothetical protein